MEENPIWTMPVHPAAEIFPMLSPDELDELAADVKANGLAYPIIVKDGVLIDGRNRREACRIAGVEPKTSELNGQDATAYVLSSNIHRRHLSKGQRAMAVAMAYPEAKVGGARRAGISAIPAAAREVNKDLLSQARKVLRLLPHIAADVMAGTIPLGAALEQAIAAEDEKELDAMKATKAKADAAERAKLDEARARDEAEATRLEAEQKQKHATDYIAQRLELLRKASPELAESVDDGTITLADAERLQLEKVERLQALCLTAKVTARELMGYRGAYSKPSFRREMVPLIAAQFSTEDALASWDFTREFINQIGDAINEERTK